MIDVFDRLYELLSDSGFLTIAVYAVVGISVFALIITIFNFIIISIRSISNVITKKKNEDDIAFGEQIRASFDNFLLVIGMVLVFAILSVPVFLIVRKVFQLLGQFIAWLLV